MYDFKLFTDGGVKNAKRNLRESYSVGQVDERASRFFRSKPNKRDIEITPDSICVE